MAGEDVTDMVAGFYIQNDLDSTGKNGPGFQILDNEPRVVSDQTVQHLKESGASRDLIAAAERAAKTNP